MNLLNCLLCLLEICCITSISTTGYTKSLNLLTSSFQTGSHIVVEYEVCKCDVSALRGELHSDSLTDAASSTCYKGCFTT